MPQPTSRNTASSGSCNPVPLNALFLRCGHCQAWAPPLTTFWYWQGFEQARRRGTVIRCSRCYKATPPEEQRYRVFLADGQCIEGEMSSPEPGPA